VSAPSRHVSLDTLNEYMAANVRAALAVPGDPVCLMTVDMQAETLQVEVEWDGEQPPTIEDYVHIGTDVVHREGRNWAVIRVSGARFFSEALPLLSSVSDLVQLEHRTFAEAVRASLATYHDLLEAHGQMSISHEIGLYGELLAVEHLIRTIGPTSAFTAWRGAQSEEHDVGLDEGDVEIKTTTSEERRHWIGSVTQLQPSPDRPLWLLSIQLTGAGAEAARRLPDVVDAIQDALPSALHAPFGARLTQAGYGADQTRDTYRLLRLRSRPRCFLVDDAFPRISPEMLVAGGVAVERIPDVSYTVMLDGMRPGSNAPRPLATFGLS